MQSLRKFLVSLRTAVFLIGVISILSLLGTLIPQGREISEYLIEFPKTGNWILALGIDDLYHGTLFTACLCILAVSALICMITRLKLTRRRLFESLERATIAQIQSYPIREKIPADQVKSVEYFDSPPKEFDNGARLYLKMTGKISLIGGILIHAGFLAILAGGLWGAWQGVETVIQGTQGEKISIPPIDAVRAAVKSDRLARIARGMQTIDSSNPKLREIASDVEELRLQYRKGIIDPLFKICFDDLWVDYHVSIASGESPAVKSWNTRVSIEEKGQKTASAAISVNEPFSYGPYRFFQADWSKKFKKVEFSVTKYAANKSPAGDVKSLTLSVGTPFKPDWSPHTFLLMDFLPDFKIIGNEFVSVSDELRNPAGRIIAYNDQGKTVGKIWAFSEHLSELAGHVSDLPYSFVVQNAEPTFESGIQVSYDPGSNLVWIGCIVMTLGLLLCFYVYHREEWLAIKPDGTAILAVSGNRPSSMLRSDLEKIATVVTMETHTKTDDLNDEPDSSNGNSKIEDDSSGKEDK